MKKEIPKKICLSCKEEKSDNEVTVKDICRSCRNKAAREYRKTSKGLKSSRAAVTRMKKKYREKWNARENLRYHIKVGHIIRPKICQVCNLEKPIQAHHTDYSKYLDVMWVCSGCHADIHKKLKSKTK